MTFQNGETPDDLPGPHDYVRWGRDDWVRATTQAVLASNDDAAIERWRLAAESDEAYPETFDPSRRFEWELFCLEEERRRARTRPYRARPQHVGVGLQLRAARARAALTLDALATHVGISRAVLNKVELGTRALRFEEACRVADALGVPLDTFRPALL